MTLDKTPADRLEEALDRILDIDGETPESLSQARDALVAYRMSKMEGDVQSSEVGRNALMRAISNAYGFLWRAEGDRRHNQAFDMSCRAREMLLSVMEKADQKKGIDYSAEILGAIQNPPPQSVEDDELVERLRAQVKSCNKSIAENAPYRPRKNSELVHSAWTETRDCFLSAITRLQSQSANPWVKIEDESSGELQGEDLALWKRMRARVFYNSEDGQLYWRKTGEVAGGKHKSSGYWRFNFESKSYTRARAVWFLLNKEWPDGIVDHISRDRTDDRIENLRVATPSQNMANKMKLSSNTSGYAGVSWVQKDKAWRAAIKHKGETEYLGYYKTAEEAHIAYKARHVEVHGEFSPYHIAPPKTEE